MSNTSTAGASRRFRRPAADLPLLVVGVDPNDLTTSDGKPLASDRVRYSVLGLSVLITATFSGSSLIVALSLATGNFNIAYIAFGLIWAFFIFNLDRWIVSSVEYAGRSVGTLLKKIALTCTRLAIAAVVGLSIAEPLLMLIFASEISVETELQLDRQIREAQAEVRSDPIFDPTRSPQAAILATAQTTQAAAAEAEQEANDALDAETSGTGGTLQAGDGSRTRERRDDLIEARERLDQANTDLADAQSAYDGTVQSLLKLSAEAEAARELSIRTRPIGLIDRAIALESLAARKAEVFVMLWIVRLSILLIDVSPVVLKLLTPRTALDQRLQERIKQDRRDIVLDARSAARIRQAQREALEQGALYALQRDGRARDEEILRESDLRIRSQIAQHAQQIENAKLEDFPEVKPLSGASPNPLRGQESVAAPFDDRTLNGDESDVVEEGDIAPADEQILFDRRLKRNVQGKPGAGLEQYVAKRWKIGGPPISEPNPVEPWRAAFLAHDRLDTSRRKRTFVIKRVRPAGDKEEALAPVEVRSLPLGDEVSPFVAPHIQAGYDREFGYFVVTPYYRNGTLQELINSEKQVTLRMCLTYTEQILRGLSAVFHQRYLSHYDIKPSNVALDDKGVRIIDWGLAAGDGYGDGQTGYSLWYSPIEQVEGFFAAARANGAVVHRQWQSPRCDIHAVGATLYCLITGRPPLLLEAKALNLLTTRGHLHPGREEDYRRLLGRKLPTPIISFSSEDPSWDRDDLRPLSDLLQRWLSPDPAARATSNDSSLSAYEVALHDLLKVFGALTRSRSKALGVAVGRETFVEAPLIGLEDLNNDAVPPEGPAQNNPTSATMVRANSRAEAGNES